MTRLLLDRPVDPASEIEVTGEEHHYLSRVRRHRPGDRVELRDKLGNGYNATLLSIGSRKTILRVEDSIETDSPVYPVRLMVAVPKRNLLDDVVRKASEIGIEGLTPVITARSVAKPDPDKVVRWRRIADEALRQCGRASVLKVDDIQPLGQALASGAEAGSRFILHPGDGAIPSPSSAETSFPAPPLIVAVGPEGGFTEEEMGRAAVLGYRPIRLPMPILRVETAAIAASVLMVAALAGGNPFSLS